MKQESGKTGHTHFLKGSQQGGSL